LEEAINALDQGYLTRFRIEYSQVVRKSRLGEVMRMKKIMSFMAAGILALGTVTAQADGQAVYDKHCKGCHVAGVGGAPKPGDTAAWDARKAAGMDVMVQTVVTGKGAMPPKGTCASCDEAALKAAVEVLLAQ